jgi:hypothetical protein
MRFFDKTKPPDELAGHGIRGRATVEHVEMLHGGMDVKVSRRKVDAVLKGGVSPLRERARLRIEIPEREAYSVTTTVTVPIAKSSLLAAGSVLEVLVDPKDRERLSIDWDGAHQRGTAEPVIMRSTAARAELEGLGLDPARVAREADEARRRALADRTPAATAEAHVPIWPTGIARFDGHVLEVTTGDGIRVAARDIAEIGVESPRDGRLTLRLSYQAGLDRAKTSYWVAPQHETALQLLVDAVATTKGQA